MTAVPAGFTDTLVASVGSPTALAFTPDGRLLVTTQFGDLRVVQNGSLLAQPALDLGPVLCTADEQGLLGVEIDAAFATTGFVYLYYTRNASGTCANRVSRFTMSGSTIDAATELVLVDGIPSLGNHNAGDLHFGKDGYLYVSVGDGGCDYAANSGCAGANDAARDRHVLLGKILRVTSTGGIPPSNPFQGAGTARCNVTGRTTAGTVCQETFAWGLRNPFRMAFDPNAAGTRFFVNDVGQSAWEEIDEGQAGADYGWNLREGPCANGSQTNCGSPPAGMTNPVYAYSHTESSCHAITGGAFVPNGVWPAEFDGSYLYGDYTCGRIFRLTPAAGGGFARSEFATGVGAVVNLTFGPSANGQALYYTNYTNGGEVRRLDFVGQVNRPPTAQVAANPSYGPLPLAVAFDAAGSADPDAGDTLTYVWSFGDGSAPVTTTSPTVSHTYTAAGTFTATLTVRDQKGASSAPAGVRIDPGNTPPTVQFEVPAPGTRLAVGETITLRGTATDAQDGALADAQLTWRVLRHHDTHTHPFLAPTQGNGVPITGPPPEDLGSGSDGYLEVQLTATDSAGLASTITRDVHPKKVDVTLATEPAGLSVKVNGTTYATPRTLTSWEGHVLDLEAPAQTDAEGKAWSFRSWSDGGAASHAVVTPASAATYTAAFDPATTPAGLVAAFGFDEGSGTSVSGGAHSGVVSGAAWSSAGRFGSALSFDGANDWVTVPDADALDLRSALTVEAWVRPSRLGAWRTVLVKERQGGILYSLFASEYGSKPVGQVDIGGERNALGTSSLPVGVWSHLAVTYDGAALRLYVNGTLEAQAAVTGFVPVSTGAVRIGGNGVWGEWFAGSIDEVRLYSRALSQAELQQDMQTPVAGAPPAPPPPDQPPAVSLTSPAAGATVSGTIAVTATASDDVSVAGVQVRLDGNALGAEDTQAPYSVSWDTTGVPNGSHTLTAVARDGAGRTTASAAVSVTVMNAPREGALVAAFGFGEGSGTSVSGGPGMTGTVSGAAWSTAGRFGSALSFDGTNDWVTVPHTAALDLQSALTIEAWVRPSRVDAWRTVVVKERSGGIVYSLYASESGAKPVGQVYIAGERNALGSASLPTNVWSHLAVTYDGSALRLYVNGQPAGQALVTGLVPASTGALRIGGNGVWGEWFAGLIDEVRVYSRALTQAEVQQDMQTPAG